MDFSEKDAARSKYKHTRKNQRGRGRGGRGWGGAARGGGARSAQDLGSNFDRYEDADTSAEASGQPVRRSQGDDLAEWLHNFPSQDPTFFARQRVNLHQEVGLPPAEPDTFQGLSFDLEGLAAYLDTLPLHQVLKLPPPSDDNDSDTDGGGGDDDDDAVLCRVVETVEKLNLEEEGKEENAHHAREAPPVEDAALHNESLDDVVQPPLPSLSSPLPPPRIHTKPQVMGVDDDEDDDELDALLGLGIAGPSLTTDTKVPPTTKNTASTGEGGMHVAKEIQSLEDWLDTL